MKGREEGGLEVGAGRAAGGRYLVFLQGCSDLAEVQAQGLILHQLPMLLQPGFLLLTVVQELGLLQALLQQGPPGGRQGPQRDWGGLPTRFRHFP